MTTCAHPWPLARPLLCAHVCVCVFVWVCMGLLTWLWLWLWLVRGTRVRFDELVRDVRHIYLRKHPDRWHADQLEKAVVQEAAALMDRFDMCLAPVDSREKSGYDYKPTPVDTSKCSLPPDFLRVGELVAENCHEVWSQGRIDDGWTWGEKRDNSKKKHPDLIPYSELTEETKQYDRDTAFETLKVCSPSKLRDARPLTPRCFVAQVIVALNYKLVKSKRPPLTNVAGLEYVRTPNGSITMRPKFGVAAPPGQTYVGVRLHTRRRCDLLTMPYCAIQLQAPPD